MNITIPKRKFLCVAKDISNKELYSFFSPIKIGDIYEIEGSLSGDLWYIFDKVDNFIAAVKYEFIELNFVEQKKQKPKILQDSFPIHTLDGKYVCINDCEIRQELNYVMLPKIFEKGRTYNIKTSATAPHVRYIYKDGPTMEHFIGTADVAFIEQNFSPRNKEYLLYQEIDNIFDKYFLNEQH